ncbi:MAG: CxxC motif-containing protein (DUF1111 family) [Myxococcota bacterium]|jgi:CxxC motif-containing protein (DUF1111 family)
MMKTLGPLLTAALLVGCPGGGGDDMALYWAEQTGDAALLMDPSLQDSFDRGREVMTRDFDPSSGLGPTFNADSCASCHQAPVAGGSGPRYRDFWLVFSERFDGSLEPQGSNGDSPVRNLYALGPSFHIGEPEDTVVYARRQAASGLGVGLFAFVDDEDILANADILDENGDGISGRANFEQRAVGRFGFKSQAATLESFNRGAMFNQMGITSDPLFFDLPGAPSPFASVQQRGTTLDWLIPSAFAQVAATTQPTVDDDGVADPEMSNQDQEDLLIFSTYVAPPPRAHLDDTGRLGQLLFGSTGCESCHLPSLPSSVGELPAYTDLLLHDMGPDLDDRVIAGLATGSEFRTSPLWAVSLHGPYMHDGRADTLHDAIAVHGGEASASRDRYLALPAAEQQAVVGFMRALGGGDVEHQNMVPPQATSPEAGEMGGPRPGLSDEQLARFDAGRRAFDRDRTMAEGLGTHFNADSCRACHRDPVVGGAGGVDVNVVRYGQRDLDGAWLSLDANVLPRSILPGLNPVRLPDAANVIEWRNPPTILGTGQVDGIAESAILANADEDDADGDGISGRARILADGQVGRYGWKANVPSALDFVADALLNENGLTIDPALSGFTTADDNDGVADPELATAQVEDLTFFLMTVDQPQRKTAADVAAADRGEASFTTTGCADCHLPELDGVPAFSDFLLHDIAPDAMVLVEQDPGVLPTEYRTSPLWGLSDTGPWLHDGTAFTLEDAIVVGHFGEASASRMAYEALSEQGKSDLLAYLGTL